MTCTHVLGLIDAGPFADYPRAHMDAAWTHARQCATCGPALRAATALATDLAALAQPAPPPDLATRVLERTARMEDRSTTAAAAAAPAAAPLSDWSPWAMTAGGLAAALAIAPTGSAAAPLTSASAFALAGSLGLYVAGLFAPIGGRDSHRTRL